MNTAEQIVSAAIATAQATGNTTALDATARQILRTLPWGAARRAYLYRLEAAAMELYCERQASLAR